ncbi:hypothetical protein GMORB2_0109 [Geosmithia morbida]|uniref:Uncharacterized protein n=1 Tax=Geosmithia morbida TaxID=1094350 RepID=A0A9P4Z354_9HYPO|nr:uncharacterized protein GMORB2_0109 [Geosmithia morbida]KAF4126373.1 hypothetical protein GMORB2_0109 [Geosmithia morbida]
MDLEGADGDDATAAAMAQMMGFSSFGAQDRPQKKRKYNAGADASVAAAPVSASTGSNSTPLGSRSSAPTASTNTDEIGLDDEDDEDDEASQGREAAAPAPVAASPRQPPPLPHGLPQRPAPGTGFVGDASVSVPAQQDGQLHRHASSLPPPPPHHDTGQPGTPWYEGYYDTLSNRNPWEKLEKAIGLEAKGTWLTHQDG